MTTISDLDRLHEEALESQRPHREALGEPDAIVHTQQTDALCAAAMDAWPQVRAYIAALEAERDSWRSSPGLWNSAQLCECEACNRVVSACLSTDSARAAMEGAQKT